MKKLNYYKLIVMIIIGTMFIIGGTIICTHRIDKINNGTMAVQGKE